MFFSLLRKTAIFCKIQTLWDLDQRTTKTENTIHTLETFIIKRCLIECTNLMTIISNASIIACISARPLIIIKVRFKITKRCKEAKICARNEVQDKSLKHKSAKSKTKKNIL
jgi:hypothetical protein